LGTSLNAVLTQIWTAMIYYLLLSYIKFKTSYRYLYWSWPKSFVRRPSNTSILSTCWI